MEESGETKQVNQIVTEVTIFPVPFPLGEIKENITINTHNPSKLSQEKIIFELRQSQVIGEQIYEKVILSLKNKKNISEKLGSIKQSLLVSESNKFTKAIQEIFSK